MRTDIDSTTLMAPEGFQALQRITFHASRYFRKDFDAAYQAPFVDEVGIQTDPLPVDAKLVDGIMTHVYNYAGVIKIGDDKSLPITVTYDGNPLGAYERCRPAIIDAGPDTFQIFFCGPGKHMRTSVVDKVLFDAGDPTCALTYDDLGAIAAPAHLHAVSTTELVALRIDDGGVRFTYVSTSGGAWSQVDSPGRVIHPTGVYTSDDEELGPLNHSAAVLLGDKIYAYLSYPDGNVMAMYFDKTTGRWSEVFEAVAADLSVFAIANAFAYENKVYLCGQFQRVDPHQAFASTYVYNLLLASTDGRTFCLDRNTMFTFGDTLAESNLGASRFMAQVENPVLERYGAESPAVIYSCCGLCTSHKAGYSLVDDAPEYTASSPISLSGDYNNGWQVRMSGLDRDKLENFHYGDAANLFLGIPGMEGTDWFLLQECLLTGIKVAWEDGRYTAAIDLVPWSVGKLADVSHPFYLELQGKQSVYDPLDDWSNLYKASEDEALPTPLYADFWGEEGTCKPVVTDPGDVDFVSTGDLQTTYGLTEYPKIEVLPSLISIYGWSRAGDTTNNETGGGDRPSDPDAENATIWLRLTVKRGSDELEIECMACDTTYQNWPQTWYVDYPGDYPVVIACHEGDGLQTGDLVTKIEVALQNNNASDKMLSYVERIESEDLKMYIDVWSETWKEIKATEEQPDSGQELVRTGAPVIYFSTKPFYTVNCQVAAKYRMEGSGSWCGVVACAHDSKNYIAARATLDKLQLIQVRDGKERVLAQKAITWYSGGMWIMLVQHDGVFQVYLRQVLPDGSLPWITPELTYSWKEADGALLKDKDISHVGIYASRQGAWVRITGFDQSLSSTMGILPASPQFANFPATGRLTIDGVTYGYSGKVNPPSAWRGPFQGRNVSGPYAYPGYKGKAAEFTLYENIDNGENKTKYNGHVMAVDSGFAWNISSVDFHPFITTHGKRIYLKNRARFFSPQANGDVVGMSTRVFVTAAFTGVARLDGEETTHACGTLATLSSNSKVVLHEFCASSGHGPLTDEDMLRTIALLAGAKARFPGDKTYASITLSATPYEVS